MQVDQAQYGHLVAFSKELKLYNAVDSTTGLVLMVSFSKHRMEAGYGLIYPPSLSAPVTFARILKVKMTNLNGLNPCIPN